MLKKINQDLRNWSDHNKINNNNKIQNNNIGIQYLLNHGHVINIVLIQHINLIIFGKIQNLALLQIKKVELDQL